MRILVQRFLKMWSFGIPPMIVAKSDASLAFWHSVTRRARECSKWMCVALLFVLWPLPNHAEDDVLSVEPQQVRMLLNEALKLELFKSDPDKAHQAAILYCEASMLGSLEAQYHLGMLYVTGMGMPESNDFAAAMFSLAAQQGLAKAQDMLEIVHFRTPKLPACVVDALALPELPVVPNNHSKCDVCSP